jgi:uncharacterized membrane protein (UPF0127 family)
MPSWAAYWSTPGGLRWLLRLVVGLVVVGFGSCFAVGADRAPNPHVLAAGSVQGVINLHSSPTSRVPGFGHIGFRVVDSSGRVGPLRCALLADNDAQREKGMMGRRDLAGYDAMIFRIGADSNVAFYNKNVPIALSVAWFDGAGLFVGAADMAVCNATCPTFAPSAFYRLALEVPKGGLHHLGIGQGSLLFAGGSC